MSSAVVSIRQPSIKWPPTTSPLCFATEMWICWWLGVSVPMTETISTGSFNSRVCVAPAKRIFRWVKHPTQEATVPALILCSVTKCWMHCLRSSPLVRRTAIGVINLCLSTFIRKEVSLPSIFLLVFHFVLCWRVVLLGIDQCCATLMPHWARNR